MSMKRLSKSLPVQFSYDIRGRHIYFTLTVMQLNVIGFKIHVDTFMFLFHIFTEIGKELIKDGTIKNDTRREPNQTNKDVVPYGKSGTDDRFSRKTFRRRDQTSH